jgi:hypothetical protein
MEDKSREIRSFNCKGHPNIRVLESMEQVPEDSKYAFLHGVVMWDQDVKQLKLELEEDKPEGTDLWLRIRG